MATITRYQIQDEKAKVLAARIKAMRLKKNFSLRDASRKTFVSSTTIKYWEEIDCNPTVKNLNDYIEQYGYELKICKIEK